MADVEGIEELVSAFQAMGADVKCGISRKSDGSIDATVKAVFDVPNDQADADDYPATPDEKGDT